MLTASQTMFSNSQHSVPSGEVIQLTKYRCKNSAFSSQVCIPLKKKIIFSALLSWFGATEQSDFKKKLQPSPCILHLQLTDGANVSVGDEC